MQFDWITWSIWFVGLVILIIWIVIPLREFRGMLEKRSKEDAHDK